MKRNAGIARMLQGGSSWTQIQAATRCSRATIAKIAKRASVASIDEPVKPRTERVPLLKRDDRGAAGESLQPPKRRQRAS